MVGWHRVKGQIINRLGKGGNRLVGARREGDNLVIWVDGLELVVLHEEVVSGGWRGRVKEFEGLLAGWKLHRKLVEKNRRREEKGLPPLYKV